MINLIKKDLILSMSKKNFLIFIVYFFIICITTEDTLPSDNKYIVICVTITFILSSVSFSYDDRLKGEYILLSLPVKKRNIVLSKYLSIFMYIIFSLIILGILGGITTSLNIFKNLNYINFNVVIKSIFIILLLCSINFPFYFFKGFSFGKLSSFVLYLIFFMSSFMYTDGNLGLIEKFKTTFFKNTSILLNLTSLVIILCILILSMIISINAYEKKFL